MFAKRLKIAMESAGYDIRPSTLEREFNLRYWGKPITFQAVRRWLRGDSVPSQEKLQLLAKWLRIDPHYLRYGESGDRNVVIEPLASFEASSSSEERQILSLYRTLPIAQRKVLRKVLETFVKAYSNDKIDEE